MVTFSQDVDLLAGAACVSAQTSKKGKGVTWHSDVSETIRLPFPYHPWDWHMYTYMSNETSGYFGDYATQFCEDYDILYTSSGDEILLMHIRFIIGMVRIPSSTSQINRRKFQHIPGTYCQTVDGRNLKQPHGM